MAKTLADLLREIRSQDDNGKPEISLRNLAESADMDPAYLSRLETGKVGLPRQETLERLATALCELKGLSAEQCAQLKRELLVKAGYMPGQEDLIDDLGERFAHRLREEGLPEYAIDEAVAKVPLATMRAVLLGEERLEIGGLTSTDFRLPPLEPGEQMVALDSSPARMSFENSASEYLENHAQSFISSRRRARSLDGSSVNSPSVNSLSLDRASRATTYGAGPQARIIVNKKVSKHQERQLRLIARLITSILEGEAK